MTISLHGDRDAGVLSQERIGRIATEPALGGHANVVLHGDALRVRERLAQPKLVAVADDGLADQIVREISD